MNVRRREFIAATGLAVLSGCTGDGGTDEATSPVDRDTARDATETVSADEVSFPDGVSEHGVEDAEAVVAQTADVIASDGARIEYDEIIDHSSYVSSSLELLVDPESRELLLNRESFQDYASGEVTGEYRMYVSWEREEALTYHMEGGIENYDSSPEALERSFEEVMQVLSTDSQSGIGNVSGFEYAFDEATRRDDGAVLAFEAVETTNELEFSSSLEEDDYELEDGVLRVRDDGGVAGYSYTLADGEGRNYEMTLESEFGDTDVPRPDWVDEAKQEV